LPSFDSITAYAGKHFKKILVYLQLNENGCCRARCVNAGGTAGGPLKCQKCFAAFCVHY